MPDQDLYSSILERIFFSRFKRGMTQVDFEREDLTRAARDLRIRLPKNLGDILYSFRYRRALPDGIRAKAGKSNTWIIRSTGRSKYRFVLVPDKPLTPNLNLALTKVPDSTPGVIAKYALSDEQALLARVRYNRLVDIFTGVACFSLQNHLRTTAPAIGQVETDELYVGVDKAGIQYVFPIQAKGGSDKLNVVQIEQDIAVCRHKFPSLVCRPIGAQFLSGDAIALFEFEDGPDGVSIYAERHYKLVPPGQISVADLERYQRRLAD